MNHLGIKNAVPKTILQLMNVEDDARERGEPPAEVPPVPEATRGVTPSAPLPADIMQRVHPFQYPGTATASAAAMHAAAGGGAPSFAPTIEQMHAGGPARDDVDDFPAKRGSLADRRLRPRRCTRLMAATAQFAGYMGAAGQRQDLDHLRSRWETRARPAGRRRRR